MPEVFSRMRILLHHKNIPFAMVATPALHPIKGEAAIQFLYVANFQN